MTHYELVGGGHQWYTTPLNNPAALPYNSSFAVPQPGITLNDVLWNFFASHPKGSTITLVSNASAALRLSPDMIVSVYGYPIAAVSQDGTYPNMTVGGTSITVTDSAGVSRTAILFAVFPTQINLLIPAGSALGNGTLTINQNGSAIASANIVLYDYAPGFFTETSKPDGPAAVSALRAFNGQNTPINVLQCSNSGCVPVAIDTSQGTVVLSLYGTGIHTPALSEVSCMIGAISVPVMYAGPQGLAGLDQVNVVIPNSLAGAGQQTVTCSVNGEVTNSPYIIIK